MSVICRMYVSNDVFKIGDRLYTNGYVREGGKFLFFIQKSLITKGFEGSYFPEPTAIFKIKAK